MSAASHLEIDLSARDRQRIKSSGDSDLAAEMVLEELPLGVYVKLDNCNREFLPAVKCQENDIFKNHEIKVICFANRDDLSFLKAGLLSDPFRPTLWFN